MLNFLLSACSGTASAAAGNGCYDWPVIKQIVWLFSEALGYLYKFLDLIGIANIGLVIILFTLVVKFILLPLTIKQQKTTKLQSFMQPELSAIQKKYQGQRDQYSMQAMQAETKAVYAKYGISQTGGCLQSFIQLPILVALYGALRNIPTAVDKIANTLSPVADLIINSSDSVREQVAAVSNSLTTTDQSSLMNVLYSLPNRSWTALQQVFSGADATMIATNHQQFAELNSFLGWNLSQSPWEMIKEGFTGGGFVLILSVFIPLISGGAQWLSFKLTQTKQSAQSNDQMASTGKMMGLLMPLMSVYFAMVLNSGLGLYWCMSSIFQVVLQIIINKHYRNVDMKALLEENMQKAEEKAKKKGEKAGVSGSTISSAANINTKNIGQAQNNMPQRPRSISDIAHMDVNETSGKAAKAPANSLAAKAGAVAQYNEEHPEDKAEVAGKRKYKK